MIKKSQQTPKMAVVSIHQKQREFISAPEPIIGFCSGRGAGKSLAGSIKILNDARNDWPCMAVSPDYTQVMESTFPAFKEAAKMMGRYIRDREKPYPIIHFRTSDRGRSELVFRSADEPETLRGPSKAILWLDEAQSMPEDAFNISYPCLRFRGRMGQCCMTFTPRGRQHWTFRKFYVECEEDEPGAFAIGSAFYCQRPNTRLVHCHTSENPFAPESYVDNISSQYSELLRRQELGGEFIDLQGLMFNRDHFVKINFDAVPRRAIRVRYWDRASATGKDACYTASVLMARPLDHKPLPYIVEHVMRGRWSPAKRDELMVQQAQLDRQRYNGEVIWYVEQEGNASGREVAQQTVTMLSGHPVYLDVVGGRRFVQKGGVQLPGPPKVVRALAAAAAVERGDVAIVREGGWPMETFLEEITSFPESTYCDQTDAFVGAFNKLAGIGPLTKTPNDMIQDDREMHTIGSKWLSLQRLTNIG